MPHGEAGLDDLDAAELLRAREAHALQVVRVILAAVGDTELAVCRLRVVDHLLALAHRHFHRLLAEHVFAGLEGSCGLLGVKRVRRDDVDDVDVGVLRQLMHRVVGEDAGVGEAVLLFPLACLGRRVGDDAGEAAEPGVLKRGGDLVLAEAAEAA